jgi:hypothetical protein
VADEINPTRRGTRGWRAARDWRAAHGTARKAVLAVGLAGYAWVAGALTPFTAKSLLSVLVPGAVLGAIAYGRAPRRIPPPQAMDIAGFSYWAIGAAVLLEWEASAVISGSTWHHPSLTQLVSPLIGPHPVKSAAMLAWLLSGWALVRR